MAVKDHYEVLGISHRRDEHLSRSELRKAYHKTLLQHHPDKSRRPADQSDTKENAIPAGIKSQWRPTVDQISTAFITLGDPKARVEYDRQLAHKPTSDQVSGGGQQTRFFSGLDTVDLDELDFDAATNCWRRSCRCGHSEGFVVTEPDLEQVVASGELLTGCRGCSLWLRVLFEVDE